MPLTGKDNTAEAKELTPAEMDLLQQIEELTATESRTEHFRMTWEKRVRAEPIATFKAIGETRVAKREGRIKSSIGGTLNWHFNNFREAARRLTALKREIEYANR